MKKKIQKMKNFKNICFCCVIICVMCYVLSNPNDDLSLFCCD